MNKKILISTGALAIVAFISKIIGFLKQATVAAYFGAGISADIYFLSAGIIANLIYAIDIAIRTVVLPMYSERRESQGESRASKLITCILFPFIIIAVSVAGLMVIFAPLIAKLIAFSYDDISAQTLIYYIRIISVSLVFSTTAAIFSAVLNANRLYIFPRAIGILQSLIAILCVITLHQQYGILALVFSIPLAYFLQALFIYLFTRKWTELDLSWQWPSKDLKTVLKKMAPVLIGSTMVQINQIVDKIISSSLKTGSVSALSYSGTLYDFVGTIFIASVTTVFFTELSLTSQKNNLDTHKQLLRRGISSLSLLLVPITVISIIFSGDIVAIVFQRGEFDSTATVLTSGALIGYSVGFLFYGIRELLARSFYATGDTKTPMINSIVAVILNIIFSVILSRIIGVAGIAFATSISSIQSVIFLGLSLQKKLKGLGIRKLLPTLGKIFFSATIMTTVLITRIYFFPENLHYFLRFIFATGIGFTVYYIMLKLLRCRELIEFEAVIHNKILKMGG